MKIEINRMRNGYIIDTLTSVDIQAIVKKGGKVIEIYQSVFYRENFKVPPFRNRIDNLFVLRLFALMIDDKGLEDQVKKLNTMPLQLGAFVISNSKRIMNNFIHALIGF